MGTTNALAAYLLIQPPVQEIPLLTIALGAIVVVIGYLRAPEDKEV